jgi:hypothetical protein
MPFQRSRRTLVALRACLAASATCLISTNAPAQTSDIDRDAAERRFSTSTYDLHKADQFPDGAKGRSLHSWYEPGFSRPSNFKSNADYHAYLIACNTDAIVLAKYLDSEPPVLTTSKSQIYTASHFAVTQVIKGNGLIAPGQTIVTYQPGGELADQGEVLRVETPGIPPYKPGGTYLVPLNRDNSASVPQYSVLVEGTAEVRATRVYPSEPRFVGFHSGTTTAAVVASFTQASTQKCSGM